MTGTERKRAWRLRQANGIPAAAKAPAAVQEKLPDQIVQTLRNHEKAIRAAVRLTHSLAADIELAGFLPIFRKTYWKETQLGRAHTLAALMKMCAKTTFIDLQKSGLP